jgi:drug/metabolite transporter (DMT)-like permease
VRDGLVLSMGAAAALGTSSLLLAVASRRVGTVLATAATLVLALVPLGLVAATTGFSPAPLQRSTLVLLLAGTLVAFAYLASIESLRLGPVAITSTIASSTGAATVGAAFVLLGERPSPGQWIGVGITAFGVVLASVRPTAGRPVLDGLGPLFGLVGVVLGAVANAIVRDPIRTLGPLEAIITQRTFTILVLALVIALLVWRRARIASAFDPRQVTEHAWSRPLLGLLIALGVVDALAFIAFAYALLDAPAWLVGLVSQSGRALAVVGGIVLFSERPSPVQWTGIGLLAGGLAVLSAASR